MPPNVKENVSVVNSLATLSIADFVDPKAFAPLTQPIHFIEANLIQESERLESTPVTKEEHDDYWAESNCDEKDMKASVAKEQSIQNIVNAKKQLLERILIEEEIRQMLKIEHIEVLIVSQVPKEYALSSGESNDYWTWRNDNEAHWRHDPYHPNQSYWVWPTLSREDETQQIITRILKDEELREKLSTRAIEERLRRTVVVEQHITSSANDDAYWSCGEY
jgi:hypothetical protein